MLGAAIALPWVLAALVRGLGLDAFHPLVAAVAFTPYAAATAFVPLVAALATGRWAVAAAAALALVVLVAAVAPRAVKGPRYAGDAPAPPPERRLVVMSANLLLGEADTADLVRLVREHDVDVLSLQELTPQAAARLDAAGIGALLPGRVLRPRSGAAGSGLLARRPLRRVHDGDDGPHAQLQASLAPAHAGGELRLVAVHPYPPVSRGRTRAWQTVLRGLPEVREEDVPHLLIGDFNATLDHRELRRLLARGYTDAADAAGEGLRPTWPAGLLRRPPITIDHVLIPRTFAVRRLSVHPLSGSDHRAVLAELVLPAG